MKKLIKKLVETTGPSGYEEFIRNAILEEVKTFGDIQIDTLGNLIVFKGNKGEGKKIMLSAHMDEIGIMATHIDDNGFVRFTKIGGVRPKTSLSAHVKFLNGTRGVIGEEIQDRTGDAMLLQHMYIDVGAANRQECPVKVGDIAVFDRPFMDLGNRLVAKAMDDRISCAILIETLKQLKTSPHQLFFVFSAQEEVGLRGATTAAYGIDPDIGLSVDVTDTGDTPKGERMDVRLGDGPAIKIRDGGMLSDPRIVEWMVKTAKAKKLPYQLEVLEGGTTDARAIQLTRAGVLSGCLSIPTRYLHTPAEMVDYRDVENSVSLLLELISEPIAF